MVKNGRCFILLFACLQGFHQMAALSGHESRPKELSPYFTFGNSTYEISTAKAGWVQAKNACKAQGMQLVSIETAEENNAILEALVTMPTESFWIAGTDLGHEGNFYWDTTGRAVSSFVNWAPDEPSNTSRDEHCIIIWGEANHLWNDKICSDYFLYICESTSC